MQARRGGRNRSLGLGEHGLIVAPVALIGRPSRGDVGRQRHGAPLLDGLIEDGSVKRERQRYLPALPLGFDGRIELAEKTKVAFGPEADDVAGRKSFGGLDERAPARPIEPLVQRRLDHRFGRTAAETPPAQSGRDDLGVIDHDRVAGTQ